MSSQCFSSDYSVASILGLEGNDTTNAQLCGLQSPSKHRRRRSRTIFPKETIARMEEFFNINSYPDIHQREILAQELSITEARIQVWFQNRRARHSKKQKRQKIKTVNSRLSPMKSSAPSSFSQLSNPQYSSSNASVPYPMYNSFNMNGLFEFKNAYPSVAYPMSSFAYMPTYPVFSPSVMSAYASTSCLQSFDFSSRPLSPIQHAPQEPIYNTVVDQPSSVVSTPKSTYLKIPHPVRVDADCTLPELNFSERRESEVDNRTNAFSPALTTIVTTSDHSTKVKVSTLDLSVDSTEPASEDSFESKESAKYERSCEQAHSDSGFVQDSDSNH